MKTVVIREGMERMDFRKVSAMLAKAHWCPGITLEEVLRAAGNSALVVGAFVGEEQIGYARVVSDKTRFAYFMDVIVEEAYRNNGIGQMMVRHILEHEELKSVYQWLLYTTYAHGVYEKMGFTPTAHGQNLMEIWQPRRA